MLPKLFRTPSAFVGRTETTTQTIDMEHQLDRIENAVARLDARAKRTESRLVATMIKLGVPTHVEKKDHDGRR